MAVKVRVKDEVKPRLKLCKACPFCGAREILMVTHNHEGWYARCRVCKARGPVANNLFRAIEYWDMRRRAMR